MNTILDFLNSHASCRNFTEKQISKEDELTIIKTAQRAATSMNLQAYSIIGIRDQAAKDIFAELSGNQSHISKCSLFLVFCADLYRLSLTNKKKNYPFQSEYTEQFIVATIDSSLAADRALQAAQALGMGGVMVGAIRNNPEKVSTLLKLPKLVYPVMGMSLGYPAVELKIKPRLKMETLYFEDVYCENSFDQGIEDYDKVLDELGYFRGREYDAENYPDFNGKYTWSEHTARRMASSKPGVQREHMLSYLQKRGFLKK